METQKSWTECVRQEAKSIQDRLKMTFEDENNKYIFHFADIKPYSYGFTCPDFDLFVDIYTIIKGGAKPEKPVWSWNQSLGNGIESKFRKAIPFGEEYYNIVHPKLSEITLRNLKANNKQILEILENREAKNEQLFKMLESFKY